jgi:methyl-accepting chemotaxis protein
VKIKKIRTRLLLILLPLVFIILSVLSGISYYLSREALTQSVNETAMAIGTDYSTRLKNNVDLMLSQLDGLASTPTFRANGNKAEILAALAELKKKSDVFDAVFYIGVDGKGYNQSEEVTNISDRDFYKKATTTKQKVISDPLVSKTSGKLAVVLAVPILSNNEVTGLVTATVSMEKLSNIMKDMTFLKSGYGQLIDDSGMLIGHPKNQELVGKLNLLQKDINPELNLSQPTLDDHLINLIQTTIQSGQQTQGTYTFVDNVKRIAVLTPVDLPGDQRWILTVAAPEEEGSAAIHQLSWMMLIISIICMLIAAIAIVFIAKQFAKPIITLRDECLLLAKGDLREHEATIHSEDEMGQLGKGFRTMRTNLRQLVAKVHLQSEQLAASSEELTASADQSAQATNQVAVSITDVAEGSEAQMAAANKTVLVVEQMSASLEQVAATSNEVAAQSTQAAAKASEGNTAVKKAMEQMLHIEKTVAVSAKVVSELGTRSSEIGQIVTTISSIASQTNLLALNAAIEAARAGEHGRGFAVVAEEVRKLAEQSQGATEQISTLINKIQEDTGKAVLSMDNGSKEVKLGSDVVNTAGHAFEEILTFVTQVSDQVKEISEAIEHMAQSSEKIVTSVNQIDNLSKKATDQTQTVSAATQEQAASSEAIASSSKDLARLATELQEAVQQFHI